MIEIQDLLYQLRLSEQASTQLFEKRLGISLTRYQILLFLLKHSPCNQIAVQERLKIDQAALTRHFKILEKEGFSVVKVETNPMHLLEPKRIIDDEGFFRTLKIFFNIMTNPAARKRILAMRKVFRDNAQNLNAVAIIAQKK